jgi:hypothetical protein
MNDSNLNPKKKRIDDLLLMIGGLEVSILAAQEQQDWRFLDVLNSKKKSYYERLKRVSYGLPETEPAEE